MTESDLATVRDWCAANGVSVELVDCDKGDVMYHLRGRQRWMGDEFDYWCQTEQEVYAVLWQRLCPWLASVRNLDAIAPIIQSVRNLDAIAPIIQSVRNLDAVEVEGPWKVQPWKVHEGVQYYAVTSSMSFDYFADMPEQTARRIAGILNRECGDGK